MRLVLALEASGGTYAVAVGAGGRPRAQRVSRRDDPMFAGLGDLVERTLAAAGVTFSDIATIAVDVGPGSLSSIRAAVAYANGLAFSLGAVIFPVSSLELICRQAHSARRGPLLCLRKGEGGNAYAGLFASGGATQMRYGQRSVIVPAMAGDLDRVWVAGAYRDEVAGLLPGVTVADTGVENPDVATLYQAAAADADPGRLVPAASPVNEGSKIFHEPAAGRHP
jgi:tRNA threonylcarbamoyl adenosine modification protein YeaZ